MKGCYSGCEVGLCKCDCRYMGDEGMCHACVDFLRNEHAELLELLRRIVETAGESSPLEDAIRTAAKEVAQAMFVERMKTDPEFIAAIDGLFVDALRHATTGPGRERTVTQMAIALSESLSTRSDKY